MLPNRPWAVRNRNLRFKHFYLVVTLANTYTAFSETIRNFHNLEKSTYFHSPFDQKSFLDFINHSLIFRLTVLSLKTLNTNRHQTEPSLDIISHFKSLVSYQKSYIFLFSILRNFRTFYVLRVLDPCFQFQQGLSTLIEPTSHFIFYYGVY